MTYKRRKYHHGDTHLKKRWRLCCRRRDLDQIDGDLQPDNAEKLLNQEVDLDKAGSGQFYCLHCAKYYIDERALNDHFRTKVHKRRLKALELEPYTIEDSERAAGQGNFKFPQKRKLETQKPIVKQSENNDDLEDEDVAMKETKKSKTS